MAGTVPGGGTPNAWIGEGEPDGGRTLYKGFRTRHGKEVHVGDDVIALKEGIQDAAGVAEDDTVQCFDIYRVCAMHEQEGLRRASVFRWLQVNDEVTREFFSENPVIHPREVIPQLPDTGDDEHLIDVSRIHHRVCIRGATPVDLGLSDLPQPYAEPVMQKLVAAKLGLRGQSRGGQEGHICCWPCFLEKADHFCSFRHWDEGHVDPLDETDVPTADTFRKKCSRPRDGGFCPIGNAPEAPRWPDGDGGSIDDDSDAPSSVPEDLGKMAADLDLVAAADAEESRQQQQQQQQQQALAAAAETAPPAGGGSYVPDPTQPQQPEVVVGAEKQQQQHEQQQDDDGASEAEAGCAEGEHPVYGIDSLDVLPHEALQGLVAECAAKGGSGDGPDREALVLLAPLLGVAVPPRAEVATRTPSPKAGSGVAGRQGQACGSEGVQGVEPACRLPSRAWLQVTDSEAVHAQGDYARLLASINTDLAMLREASIRPPKKRARR